MQFFDGVIIVVFLGFCWFGFWRGLIMTAGSIVGIFLGAILASRWYETVIPILKMNETPITKVIVFIALFLVIVKATGLLFIYFQKAFKVLTILPGLKLLNHLAGLILGALEGALFLGVVLNFARAVSEQSFLEGAFFDSGLVGFFIAFAAFIVPLFPEAVRKINEII